MSSLGSFTEPTLQIGFLRLGAGAVYQRASTILSDPKAARYVWGIGYHWYEPWSGGEAMYDELMTLIHKHMR